MCGRVWACQSVRLCMCVVVVYVVIDVVVVGGGGGGGGGGDGGDEGERINRVQLLVSMGFSY